VSAPLPTPSAAPTVAVASVPDKPPAASPRPARPSSPAPGTAVKPGRAGAKPNCDPPYYFDANGTKHFRKECV
jgi:hypothetical protein